MCGLVHFWLPVRQFLHTAPLARMLHRAGQTLPDLRLGEDIGATGLRLAIS